MAQYGGGTYAGVSFNWGEPENRYIASEHEERNGFRVICRECGYQWATQTEEPKCPKCSSYDIGEDDNWGNE